MAKEKDEAKKSVRMVRAVMEANMDTTKKVQEGQFMRGDMENVKETSLRGVSKGKVRGKRDEWTSGKINKQTNKLQTWNTGLQYFWKVKFKVGLEGNQDCGERQVRSQMTVCVRKGGWDFG